MSNQQSDEDKTEQMNNHLRELEISTRTNLDNNIISLCSILLGLLFGFLPYVIKDFGYHIGIKLAVLLLTLLLVVSIITNVWSQLSSIERSRADRQAKYPSNRISLFNSIYEWTFIAALVIILILTAIVLFMSPELSNVEQKVPHTVKRELIIREY